MPSSLRNCSEADGYISNTQLPKVIYAFRKSIMVQLIPVVVVSHKKGLTNDKEQATSVDWLSEVVRRYSDAAWGSKPLTSVSMKLPMRLEKVRYH